MLTSPLDCYKSMRSFLTGLIFLFPVWIAALTNCAARSGKERTAQELRGERVLIAGSLGEEDEEEEDVRWRRGRGRRK